MSENLTILCVFRLGRRQRRSKRACLLPPWPNDSVDPAGKSIAQAMLMSCFARAVNIFVAGPKFLRRGELSLCRKREQQSLCASLIGRSLQHRAGRPPQQLRIRPGTTALTARKRQRLGPGNGGHDQRGDQRRKWPSGECSNRSIKLGKNAVDDPHSDGRFQMTMEGKVFFGDADDVFRPVFYRVQECRARVACVVDLENCTAERIPLGNYQKPSRARFVWSDFSPT